MEDFHSLCSSIDLKRKENMFVKCLKEDFQDDTVVAGIRAMGLICHHISTPLMKMVESDIHFMDTDKFYTRLRNGVKEWMIDPS